VGNGSSSDGDGDCDAKPDGLRGCCNCCCCACEGCCPNCCSLCRDALSSGKKSAPKVCGLERCCLEREGEGEGGGSSPPTPRRADPPPPLARSIVEPSLLGRSRTAVGELDTAMARIGDAPCCCCCCHCCWIISIEGAPLLVRAEGASRPVGAAATPFVGECSACASVAVKRAACAL